MKNTLFLFLYVGAFLLASCSTGGGNVAKISSGDAQEVLYAKGFEIIRHNNFTEISVVNPWDTTKILQNYILVERSKPLPDNLPEGAVIKVPIQNAIIYTSVHASVMESLGALESAAGICETEYLTSQKAKEMVEVGKIVDCGKATSPNIEKIIDLKGEIIIASPFEHGGYGQVEKLGIPIFEAADYMENHPLGRVEWIKIHGLLTGKEEVADSIFNAIANEYNHLKSLASGVSSKPTLIAERKYGSSWFIPGGESYIAKMYADAGADYIFKDDTQTGSVPYSFEQVFEEGANADIWLFKYYGEGMTYSDLKAEYEPYADFGPFKKRNIYVCNTSKMPYYDYISIRPDYILADLVYIFHPQLMGDYRPKCFMPMDE